MTKEGKMGPVRGWIALNPNRDEIDRDLLTVHLTDRQRDGAAKNGWRVLDVVVMPAERLERSESDGE